MKKWLMLIAMLSVMALLAGCGGGGSTSSDWLSMDEDSIDVAVSDEETTTTKKTTKKTTKSEEDSNVEEPDETETTKSSRRTVATTKRSQSTGDDGIFPVTPSMTIKQSAKSVVSGDYKKASKIKSDYYVVSPYDKNNAYTHHPGLAVFKGKLYFSYSCGALYEDAPGQQGVVRSAPLNDLNNWSAPVVAAPSRKMANGKQSFIIPGYLFVAGDTLYLTYMEKGYTLDAWDENDEFKWQKEAGHGYHKWDFACYRVIGTKDGVNWNVGPVDVRHAANESPRLSKTGTWFAGAGNKLLTFIGKDQSKPDAFSWSHVGMTDEQYETSINRQGVSMLTEASWYQTDDYVIHQMLRCHDGFVWMSESYDNGKTWTEAFPTNFKSDTTMANFGSLPNGGYYAVANPEPTYNPHRYPLCLFYSKDGYDFGKVYILRDEQKESKDPSTFNWTKIGAYAYPEVLVYGDYMYVAYSQFKEVMSLTRVKLSDIK